MGFMAKPGWYPDPDGSGTPRYWNGERWEDPSTGTGPAGKDRGLLAQACSH